MIHTTLYPPPEFYSSLYDPKWWLNPQQNVDAICNPNESIRLENISNDIVTDTPDSGSFFRSNWYVEDLLDQLYSLRKVPTQSINNYLSEAKSLAYALNLVGEPIPETELIDCLVDGLDDSFSGFIQNYYELNPLLSLDLFSSFLHSYEKLQEPLSSMLPNHPLGPSFTLPQEHQSIDSHTPINSPSSSSISVSHSDVISSSHIIPPSTSLPLPVENYYLSVPANCQIPKSQLLFSFFSAINDYSHSHLDIFKDSFLVCSSSPPHPSNERMFSLDTCFS